MSDEDVKRLVQAMEERLEKRLKNSTPPGTNGFRGWKGAGLILSVLTAITVPILGVTWYASTKMNQLEGVQKDLGRTMAEVSSLRSEIGGEISAMSKEVQRLREAFAAYTRVVLPMMTRDPLEALQQTYIQRALPTPITPVNPGQPGG